MCVCVCVCDQYTCDLLSFLHLSAIGVGVPGVISFQVCGETAYHLFPNIISSKQMEEKKTKTKTLFFKRHLMKNND